MTNAGNHLDSTTASAASDPAATGASMVRLCSRRCNSHLPSPASTSCCSHRVRVLALRRALSTIIAWPPLSNLCLGAGNWFLLSSMG
ncbi:hypothetical protein VIGAN_01227200 [Vigna angularis var. angularis]|uniref:Uncharacterized protein n=1 Tax=Vigna angularis var. angularis TaxID=157739 RepID=A0A0S3R212_PHAAN|nr:hypothetical protein VIGAN_01227200 [Vigna angularis var. angularis]